MALYLISAWALVLLYCAVIGAWTGGPTAPALGVGTLMLGAIVLQAANFGQTRRPLRPANAADPAAVAAGLCEAVPAPAALVAAGLVRHANRAFLALLEFGGRRDEGSRVAASHHGHPPPQGPPGGLLLPGVDLRS